MLIFEIIIGSLIGAYAVLAVVIVYKFKGKRHAALIRILSVSSVAIVASSGVYLLKFELGDGQHIQLAQSISFGFSMITTLTIGFFFRHRIG